MEMISVQSSHIEKIGHDPETDTLFVQFFGDRQYRYPGVSAEQFSELKISSSKGRHLRSMGIRGIRV